MTPLREAIVLPVIFLTVALLGGFRAATTVKLVPPSLTALVLAVLLLGLLARSGAIPVMRSSAASALRSKTCRAQSSWRRCSRRRRRP